jgi:U3 small nucleolar RNA-associated protein 13
VVELVGHTGPVSAVALPKTSSNFAITASHDRTVKFWDLSDVNQSAGEIQKPKSLYTFQAHEKDIQALDVSPNDVFAP